jgi:hypothetical protein
MYNIASLQLQEARRTGDSVLIHRALVYLLEDLFNTTIKPLDITNLEAYVRDEDTVFPIVPKSRFPRSKKRTSTSHGLGIDVFNMTATRLPPRYMGRLYKGVIDIYDALAFGRYGMKEEQELKEWIKHLESCLP